MKTDYADVSRLCLICREEIPKDESAANVVWTTCIHLFHKACLKPWIDQRQKCPTCKTLQDREWVRINFEQRPRAHAINLGNLFIFQFDSSGNPVTPQIRSQEEDSKISRENEDNAIVSSDSAGDLIQQVLIAIGWLDSLERDFSRDLQRRNRAETEERIREIREEDSKSYAARVSDGDYYIRRTFGIVTREVFIPDVHSHEEESESADDFQSSMRVFQIYFASIRSGRYRYSTGSVHHTFTKAGQFYEKGTRK